ncbi:uncharacterized protein LOC141915183 [Tubulanus polymorphus]|uniref:uncharacterized protein LOC141915183 n=1 Tax=Tubulanus polymorphus TaxID=672921 RepID=UPI003DA49A92
MRNMENCWNHHSWSIHEDFARKDTKDNSLASDTNYKLVGGNWIYLNVDEYTFPYPKSELEAARRQLVRSLKKRGDEFWPFESESMNPGGKMKKPRWMNQRDKVEEKPSQMSKKNDSNRNNPQSDLRVVKKKSLRQSMVLKCDYCDLFYKNFENDEPIDSDKEAMANHMSNYHHSSASIYKAEMCNEEIKHLISVQNMLYLKNVKSTRQSLVIFCPICFNIYNDIFECGLHSTLIHGLSKQPAYSIGPIYRRLEIHLWLKPKCGNCSAEFSTHKALNLHWKSNSRCLPYEQPEAGTMILWECSSCHQQFSNTFFLAKSHLICHFRKKNIVPPKTVVILMKRILCRVPRRTVPLLDRPVEDQFVERMKILKSLRRNKKYRVKGQSKPSGDRPFYKKKINELKSLIKSK